MLEALLFDVDGTLADTEEVHREAFNAAFARAGLDWVWSAELYGKLLTVTGGRERIRHYLDQYRTDYRRPQDLDGYIAELHKSKTAFYTGMIADGSVPMRPGVKRLLEQARAEGLRLAIATTTTPDNVEALLTHSLHPQAMSWFEVIAAGDIVPKKKPAPDIYLHTLQAMKLLPSVCLAFEDSENGLQSAAAAQLQTVVTVNRYTRDHNFAGALLLLDHLGEPDRPFTVLSGKVNGASYVDVALLRRLKG